MTTKETTNLGNTCGKGTYCSATTNGTCTACPSIPYRAHYTLNCSWSCDPGSTLRNGKCCIQKSYETTRYEEHCICGSITVPTHDEGPVRNGSCSWTGWGGEHSGCTIEQVAVPTTETYWSCDE